MTTALNDVVVVDARGFVVACSWCCDPARLRALSRDFPRRVSHSLCPECQSAFLKETA